VPKAGALLDVGCAEGTFLHLFQKAFSDWQIQGIEPSPSFSEFARRHYGLRTVRTTTFEELDFLPEQSFSLVTVNHVLEHLLDPNFLFIDVPDSEGVAAGLWRLHIGHVYHFTEHSLKNLLCKHGFTHLATARGDEKPKPWTLQVLAYMNQQLPSNWQPAAVDDSAIARNFARLCNRTLYTRLRCRLIRTKRIVLQTAGKLGSY
jgi:SAM-dependent methyltransferase